MDGRPRYLVDVRLQKGVTARLTVDAFNGTIGWREPFMVRE